MIELRKGERRKGVQLPDAYSVSSPVPVETDYSLAGGLVLPRNSEVARTSACELEIINLEERGRNFLDVDQRVTINIWRIFTPCGFAGLLPGSKFKLGGYLTLGGRTCRAAALNLAYIYAVWTCRATTRLQIQAWGVLYSWWPDFSCRCT